MRMGKDSARDENRTLRRQSLLIALGCVIGDGAPFLLHAIVDYPGHPTVWLVGVVILAADLALALPARTAGVVAVVHAVVRVGVAIVLLVLTGERDNGIGNATGLVVAGYRAGAWMKGRSTWVALGALIVGMTVTQVVQGYQAAADNILLTLTNTLIPFMLGRYTTGRSGYIAEIRRKADDERRAAAAAMSAAVEAERVAIARDLHDTISHHVSAVGVVAAAARLSLGTPQLAGTGKTTGFLEQIEASGRAALGDLRRMLDLLHGNDADGVRQPGLTALDELVEGTRRAGLNVDLRLAGLRPEHLPDSLNLAAYRVIQEMLTNALRYGDGHLDLGVTQTATELRLEATNRMTGGSGRGTGRGLDGIRHRVSLFGGSVTAGPAPDRPSTWRTAIVLPLQ
ncbi:sensor histidine kinase [Actinoplanes sp. N902-109]|uniref:sensor histidine kinase n=1 Tax=Actinoplanes sp. (strain N902-109) TaxID=649831 RepID=UPI0003295F19|nr:histidine kinase [Actinoplanes sp. N902-109]AGL12197.1 two-component system histidine kinase [Actinoplanes sp. N902-109]AGL16451.1 two-component system histidine kinase [Actinoplanes sp. N902-109]